MFGWTLYVALILAGGWLGLFATMEAAAPAARYFEGASGSWWGLFLYAALMPLAFVAGSRLAGVSRRIGTWSMSLTLQNVIVAPIYAILLIVFTASASGLLFQGYLEGVDSSLVGPLATLELMLLFQYLACRAANRRVFQRLFGVLLVLSSITLLGMGGRLYVASVLFGLYFYWWKWVARDALARRRSLKWAALAPIAFALIGMWRLGSFEPREIGFYLLAEPLFTSISAISFMLGETWSMFDVPKDFFSAFINIVPAALWPGKAEFVTSLSDTSLDFESPFGAMSIVTSSVANFGFVGGLVFIGLVGSLFGWAEKNAGTPLLRAFYCYLVALLPFLFFRDPFQVQIKLVVTGFLLVAFHVALSLEMRRQARPATGVLNA